MNLLIDALNINQGGGRLLLNYLVKKLEERKIKFLVLVSKKHYKQSNLYIKPVKVNYLLNRTFILSEYIQEFSPETLLCFGSYPPTKKFNCKVVVYFHRPHLANIFKVKGFFSFYIELFKKNYLKFNRNFADIYLFQSKFVKNAFIKNYKKNENILYKICPFFNINTEIIKNQKLIKENEFIYVSLDYPHKNHLTLIEAWKILAHMNLYPTLKITIPKNSFLDILIKDCNKKFHTRIQNLGIKSHDDVIIEMAKTKFMVFPSLAETLGLPLIEAAELGLKVIASNKPWISDIIKPSLSFDPLSPKSIANCVEYSIKNEIPLTKGILKNRIDEFINILIK